MKEETVIIEQETESAPIEAVEEVIETAVVIASEASAGNLTGEIIDWMRVIQLSLNEFKVEVYRGLSTIEAELSLIKANTDKVVEAPIISESLEQVEEVVNHVSKETRKPIKRWL